MIQRRELIVDNFAGGGGASTGIFMALGREVDIAINHDPEALALHAANHPGTRHLCEDVFEVDPIEVTGGQPVALAHFSPDCKHFSKAKGGKPRSKKIRALAWVAVRWAAKVRPRVIILENVEEFQEWGPLLEDGRPCPHRKGRTFRNFVARLRNLGYKIEGRELRACDYGAPTIRKRFFMIARCDGRPIVWPEPTHGAPDSAPVLKGKRKPWRTAAECIDWSLPCPSIFDRKKPLAEATLRRIARGIRKFVIEAQQPFIVQYHSAKRHGDDRVAAATGPLPTQTTENRFAVVVPMVVPVTHNGDERVHPSWEPVRTITGAHRGELALASATLIQTGYGERPGQAPRCPGLDKPAGTVVAGGQKHALVSAFLAKHYGGVVGSAASGPVHTVTATDHNALVTAQIVGCGGRAAQSRPRSVGEPAQTLTAKADACIAVSHLSKLYGTTTGQDLAEPMHTITGQGNHIAEVRAFLIKYYGTGGQDAALGDPMHTVTAKDRVGLVMVEGEEYVITDIGMRMLKPHELYLAQGFPGDYIISVQVPDRRGKVRPLPQDAQVRMCGNSVCPPVEAAIVAANLPELRVLQEVAA